MSQPRGPKEKRRITKPKIIEAYKVYPSAHIPQLAAKKVMCRLRKLTSETA